MEKIEKNKYIISAIKSIKCFYYSEDLYCNLKYNVFGSK